jgi:hypothetical protein
MATWRLGDVTVHSGGAVEGPKDAEAMLELAALRRGTAVLEYGPAPSAFRVDTSNDWAIDRFVREVAAFLGVQVETDYVAHDADMPEQVRKYVDACREKAKSGAAKGVIH